MSVPKPAFLLLLALAALLAACSTMNSNRRLFDDAGPDTVLFHGENLRTPILPTDSVKTEADAVRLAMQNCGSEAGDPSHWHASRYRDVWTAKWTNGLRTITAAINKSDGSFEDCDVNDRPLWQ